MIEFPELLYHSTCLVLKYFFPVGIQVILLRESCNNQFFKVLVPVLSLLPYLHLYGIWFGEFFLDYHTAVHIYY